MLKIIWLLTLFVSCLGFVNPAQAEGGNAELRTGVGANNDAAVLMGGIGVGYDWNLSDELFVGVQATGDLNIDGFGAMAGVVRAGPQLVSGSKIYALAGLGVLTDYGDSTAQLVIGTGIEFDIGKSVYGKIEYRNFPLVGRTSADGDPGAVHQALFGIGLRF
ncbi:MAG: hypothetical protein WA793_13335 [Sphingorhabdus sp.]|uniref:outer membrane protein n=1 Tax=Sphingorhabdus sp. TaxID=1902408 RepID=UPI003CABC301